MRYVFLSWLWLAGFTAWAQDSTVVRRDSLPNVATDSLAAQDLLAGLITDEPAPLLPDKMTLGQHIFWGKKGLLRITGLAPLTPDGRARELNLRRTMLVTHQVMGFVTLAGMVAQGLTGAALYNAKGEDYVRTLRRHNTLATLVNVAYGTTALLSYTSPPRLPTREYSRGLSSIKLHKYLAFLHLTGMIATNILGNQIRRNPDLKPYHRAAALTTFASFATAVIVIKF